MKKIIAAILVLTLALAGCSKNETVTPSETQPSVTETQAPTETATTAETQEPTAEPAPTPDAEPLGKLMITEDEFNEFLTLWPAASSPLSEHGTITSFSINSQYGVDDSSLNFIFRSDKSSDEAVAFYKELVEGEWEDSEYSAGPSVYGGIIEGSIDTTCQVAKVDGRTEVFMGMYTDCGSDELDRLIDAHWPVGLIELYESLTDEAMFFKSFSYKPGASVSYSISWNVESTDEVLDYYKNLLVGEEEYVYFEGGEYESAYVSCVISGVSVKTALSMDTRIEITLSTADK